MIELMLSIVVVGCFLLGVLVSLMFFQPVKKFFGRLTNSVFYRDDYDSDEFFARLNRTLTTTTDLRSLLERAAGEIATTLKSQQAFFFVHTLDGHHIIAGTDRHTKLPWDDALQLQNADKKKHGVIAVTLLNHDDPIRRLMISHRIDLILPLVQSGVVGYLCLGGHKKYRYTVRDIRVLSAISDELVIAIQNTLSIKEVRDINETLQQRIENATKELRSSNVRLLQLDKAKDEFVGMASHQLRTPLTSVKGYISMVLEGDAGEINETQRQFLDEAFASSERMVHLIEDFLNVSRIQNGKFIVDRHPTDLSQVVAQEIDGLQPNAKSRGLRLVYRRPKNFPMLEIDESKIRQVIMNFADNALYYSHEKTSIQISLTAENNKVIFTVKDTGIGVPSDEQEQLFSKFYRASNAKKQRPDGTGVGLYLAKTVIDSHGGKIIFESVQGKGSTFGFSLPIK